MRAHFAHLRNMVCLLALLTLTACAGRNVRECPVTPVAVEIERRVYVPVPSELTTPAPIATPANRTVRELRNVARARRDALEAVNKRLAEISQLSGSSL